MLVDVGRCELVQTRRFRKYKCPTTVRNVFNVISISEPTVNDKEPILSDESKNCFVLNKFDLSRICGKATCIIGQRKCGKTNLVLNILKLTNDEKLLYTASEEYHRHADDPEAKSALYNKLNQIWKDRDTKNKMLIVDHLNVDYQSAEMERFFLEGKNFNLTRVLSEQYPPPTFSNGQNMFRLCLYISLCGQ